jgi:MFS family permease
MPGFRIEFGYFDVVNKTLAIESIWISLWPSLLFLGYILGSLACAYLLDRFGPRKVAVAAAIFILGPIVIQALTISKEMLLVGKFLAGIGIGAFQATSGNFTAETSTPKLRSILTSSIGMALILGLVFGIAAGAAVIADIRPWHSWRLVLMLQ